MKTFTIFLFLLLSMSNTFLMSQKGNPPPQQVIFLGIFGMNPNDTRTFTLSAQGTVWGNYPSDPFSISEGELNEPPYLTTYQQTGNSDPLWSTWGGWDIVTHQTISEVIGFGLYKMTTDDSPAYFYYNTRDCHYSFACGSRPPNYNPDALFKYQAVENKFYYKIRGEEEFDPITNGQLINVWDMLNNGILPSTNGFEDYWENALVATNNGSDHPRLVWGPYPESLPGPIVNFRIYYDDHPSYIPPGPFSFLDEVGAGVYNYVDETVTMGSGFNKRSYIVKCVYIIDFDTYVETNPTNTASVNLRPPSKIQVKGDEENLSDYYLLQNFPNPFNPSTTIEYSIKNDGLIILEVYDILGNNVSTLVNEHKPAGSYEVEFIAKNLPSGIYFYILTSGNFTYARKMILLR